MTAPKLPAGASAAGARLWREVVGAFELDEHELALLVEIIRTMAVLDRLDAVVRAEGPLADSPQGVRAHPAAVESRQQRIALARLQAALRLPSGEGADAKGRPQRRSGARGVYGIRGAV